MLSRCRLKMHFNCLFKMKKKAYSIKILFGCATRRWLLKIQTSRWKAFLPKCEQSIVLDAWSWTLCRLHGASFEFRDFFCSKYRCRRKKNFNASKKTSLGFNVCPYLPVSITSLQLIFFSTRFRNDFFGFAARLSCWEISYLCQALFECSA